MHQLRRRVLTPNDSAVRRALTRSGANAIEHHGGHLTLIGTACQQCQHYASATAASVALPAAIIEHRSVINRWELLKRLTRCVAPRYDAAMRTRRFTARPALLASVKPFDTHVAIRADQTVCGRITELARVAKVGDTVSCADCRAWLNDEEPSALPS